TAMRDYFATAPAADAAWAVHILAGGKIKRLVRSGDLRSWLVQASGYPIWLIEDTYAHVGDLAETITLLVANPQAANAGHSASLQHWIEHELAALSRMTPDLQSPIVRAWWATLPRDQCFVLNKLLTGALRVGVSQRLVIQALTQLTGLSGELLAHRLSGDFTPSASAWQALIDPKETAFDADQPYPFFLASPLEDSPDALGEVGDWQAEWKWDGIRAQLLRRQGETRLWSRGEERLDGRFPEIEAAAAELAEGTVLDGEILGWNKAAPLPFARLQKRIGRLKPGPKALADCPVVFMAYDLLEWQGQDWRQRPLSERRQALEKLLSPSSALRRAELAPLLLPGLGSDVDVSAETPAEQARHYQSLVSRNGDGAEHPNLAPENAAPPKLPALAISQTLKSNSWAELAAQRQQSRELGVEGLMLKRRDSRYQVGRKRGDWWKWKIDPLTIDAVLLYAQQGHGRRANLFTDYTFAVWNGDELVPFAKAYSGLTDVEFQEITKYVRENTLDRFGPVRAVVPNLVFELAFEGIQASKRHKSGVALRFPRMHRWRKDKHPKDANTLADLKEMLDLYG
ncbi:MAG: hypothetical protein KJT03_07770, partial [Verrucomicrobiae bacterium]|nr:hypothetical protein [Verrucomicrobiae bacterium]